jgi:hypothetical protein
MSLDLLEQLFQLVKNKPAHCRIKSLYLNEPEFNSLRETLKYFFDRNYIYLQDEKGTYIVLNSIPIYKRANNGRR